MKYCFYIIIQSVLLWSYARSQWGSPQCGQVIRSKRSILETPTKLTDLCSYPIQAYNAQTCQLLIQFENFNLQQPTLQDGRLVCGDRFVVNDFILCGENSDQHLYIPFESSTSNGNGRRQLMLNFHLPNRWTSSKWRLVVTQLECPHAMDIFRLSRLPGFSFLQNIEDTTRNIFPPPTFGDLEILAPAGCHQYYTQPTGTIKSFNYNASIGALYMANMKYVICIKSKMGAKQIDYNFRKFSMSIENIAQAGYDSDCRSIITTLGRRSDFLMIPQATLPNLAAITPTYFCGRSLNGHQVLASLPFVIYFESDDISDPIETGFSIDYMVKSA